MSLCSFTPHALLPFLRTTLRGLALPLVFSIFFLFFSDSAEGRACLKAQFPMQLPPREKVDRRLCILRRGGGYHVYICREPPGNSIRSPKGKLPDLRSFISRVRGAPQKSTGQAINSRQMAIFHFRSERKNRALPPRRTCAPERKMFPDTSLRSRRPRDRADRHHVTQYLPLYK